jgi:hypothetical protein
MLTPNLVLEVVAWVDVLNFIVLKISVLQLGGESRGHQKRDKKNCL